MPGSSVLYYLLEYAQIHVYWDGDTVYHLILYHPVLLLSSIFPSIRVFFNESALLIRCTNYWRSSFSISPSNEYLGFISFRITGLFFSQSNIEHQ